jgi:hypothetical protein
MQELIFAIFEEDGIEYKSEDSYLWDMETGEWDAHVCEECCQQIVEELEGDAEIEEVVEYQEIVREKIDSANDFTVEYDE